jgi:hypothetical protein
MKIRLSISRVIYKIMFNLDLREFEFRLNDRKNFIKKIS